MPKKTQTLANVATKGTRFVKKLSDPKKSTNFLPRNEDWSFVVEITEVDTDNQIVTGEKIWDEAGTKKTFYAQIKYLGFAGTPGESQLQVGGHAVFHRTGDYNGDGDSSAYTGLQLHDAESDAKASFVCFVAPPLWIFIEDNGDGTGTEVDFNSSGTKAAKPGAETLDIQALDPDSFFHNSSPPFKSGRIYPGVKKVFSGGNYYIVFLPGMGDTEETFSEVIGSDTLEVEVDGAGHIVDISVS